MLTALGMTDQFMIHHFVARWGIMNDLYREAIEGQKNYLKQILSQDSDPRDYLKRNEIVAKIRKQYHKYGLGNKALSVYSLFNGKLRSIPQAVS